MSHGPLWRFVSACMAVVAVGVVASGCDWAQFGYASSHNGDNALDTTITPANVATLTQKFVASTGLDTPVTVQAAVNGILYATTKTGYPSPSSTLFAYSANGSNGCSGTPLTCTPLWTASLGSTNGEYTDWNLAVANGVVYADSASGLDAFDASGQTNCSGTPTVCQPLWQALFSGYNSQPTVANGSVFVTTGAGVVEAFDASGTTDCSGSPKVCSPLWTAPVKAQNDYVTVSGGIAFAVADTASGGSDVVALDANGNNGCSGTPKTCTPLWTYATSPIDGVVSTVSVSGSTMYVGTWSYTGSLIVEGFIEAFDASGVNGCSGTPTVCAPLWTSTNTGGVSGTPLVANGAAFSTTGFSAFAADGSTDCSGSPVVCSPEWSSSITAGYPQAIGGSVLYATGNDVVYAFDATGQAGCSGGVCDPLWTATLGNVSQTSTAIIANGTLYVSGQDNSGNGEVVAYGLP